MTPSDEPYALIRTLSVNYGSGGHASSHNHPWGQLLYAQSGAMRAKIENTIWFVPPRRALWIPPRTPHSFRMLGGVELRTLYLKNSLSADFEVAQVSQVTGLLHEAILRACDFGWIDERNDDQSRIAYLILSELRSTKDSVISLVEPKDPRALKLSKLFMDPAFTQAGMDTLMSKAGVSRKTAERLFRRETGLAPAQWRRVWNLSLAMEQLNAGQSIDEVSEICGYANRSAFSTAFKEFMGLSPREFRARQRQLST
ncbi:MAG: helix-turn-helix transcriptional regulator [Pseudomonadota bacterium]